MRNPSTSYRLGISVAVGTVLFLILAIGALGIIGAGGRTDRIYAAVLGVGVIGAVIARFRPYGMALALFATAATQLLVTAVALLAGLHHADGASIVDIIGINAMYAALFSLSGWLFLRAGDQRAVMAVTA